MAGGREFKDTYTIEALLTGDSSKLKRAVERAKKILDTLENDSGDIELNANAKQFNRTITVAKSKIDALNKSGATIEIKGDNSDLLSDVTQSSMMIDALKKKASVIEMNASGLEALKNFQTIKVKEIDFDGATVKVAPEVDTKVAEAKISRFKAMLKSIPNRIKTWATVDVDTDALKRFSIQGMSDDFQRNMSKMARSIESFAVVMMNQIKGLLLMFSSALVPMIAGLVPAIMAVGNAVGVLVGGLGGLIGAFGMATVAGVGWGGMMATVLSRYNSETFQATKESQRFSEAVNGIKSAWNGIVDGNQAKIFDTMSNAIEGATSALGSLKPMLNGVSDVMLTASNSFKDFISNSPIAERFFKMLNTSGVSMFETLLSAVGKFGAGVMQVFNLLEPLMVSMADGFEDMADRFLKWSQTTETAKGFEKFTNYVKTNLPLIRSIFGDTFKGIINLFSAFGENSNVIFTALAEMTARFRAWSAGVKESDGFQKFIEYVQRNAPALISLIGNVIMTLVNLGIALAPLGEKVLNLANKFFEFTKQLLANHPIVGVLAGALTALIGVALLLVPVVIQMMAAWKNLIQPLLLAFSASGGLTGALGALSSAISFLLGPIGLVIAIVAVLVASFITLWNTNEEFRTAVINIWNQIKTHITNAVTAIKDFVMQIWGTLVQWWSVHNENIMNVAMVIWTAILGVIQNTMNTIVPIIRVAWELIKGIISIALDLILGIIGVAMAVLNGDWSTAWTTIKDTATSIWETIKTMFSNVWEIIKTTFTTWLTALKTQAGETWNTIKTVATTVWNAIKTWLLNLIQTLVTNAINTFNQFKTMVSTIWNAMKTFAQSVWSMIKDMVVRLVVTLITNAILKFNEFKAKVTNIFNAVKTFLSNVWNAIKTFVVNLVTNLVNTVVTWFTNLKTKATNIFNTIKAFLTNVWNAIKSFVVNTVTALVNTVVNWFNNLKTTATNIFNAIKSFITNVWNAIKSTVTNLVRAIFNTVRNIFNNIRSTIQSIMSRVRSIISSIWNAIRSTVSSVLNSIRSTVSSIWNSIRSTISSVMNSVRSIISSIWNAIRSIVSSVTNAVRSVVSSGFNAVRSVISSVMNSARSIISSVWNSIRSVISSAVNGVRSVVSSGFNAVRSVVSSVMNSVRSVVSSVWNSIRSTVSSVTSSIRSTVSNVFNSLGSVVSSAMSRVRNGVARGMNGALRVVSGILGSFKTAGSNIVTSIANGIRGAIGKVTSAISSVTNAVRRFLPFSPAKEGALRDIMKVNIAGSIAQTIDKQRKLPLKAMEKVTSGVQKTIDRYNPQISPEVVGISQGMNNLKAKTKSVMSHTVNAEVNSQPIQANIHMTLGKREYETQVSDMTHAQNEDAKLNERYGI